jgi:hypothetical protein
MAAQAELNEWVVPLGSGLKFALCLMLIEQPDRSTIRAKTRYGPQLSEI